MLPVWYKTQVLYVTRLVLENSPVSRAPVDKILAARRKETQGAAFSRSDTPSLAVVRSRQGRFWATEGDLYQWGRARGRVSPDPKKSLGHLSGRMIFSAFREI